MKLYRKHYRQNLPITADNAWGFLSDPKNLAIITPPDMKFETVKGDDRLLFTGQIIEYRITPLWGIKMKWVTEITHVEEKHHFIDEQRSGPYAMWRHKHFINTIPGGIEMEDILDYGMPFGLMGQWLHPWIAGHRIEAIFRYRENKLRELFGTYNTGL